MHRRISQAATVFMVLALLITGCTSQASNIGIAKDKENHVVDTGFSVSTVGSYDSADTAVVISTDQQNNSVTFMNMGTGRQYTLYYDGTTYVKDKYDGPMTISQINEGDVVDVNFLKGKRQIASIKLSPQAWVYDNVGNYDLGGVNKTASIGSTTYSLPDDVVVLSDGKRAEVMDIVAQDVVSIQGIDHKIYSINIEKGHGYLRLKNDQALIGGWIEVGNTVIRQISEDMLLVVPEGSYQVFLSNNGASCAKDVTIERDKEVVLDVGDLEITKDKTGKILLSVTPENAKVSIDGKSVDISSAIELPYGIHQVHLEAAGYDSLTKYIQVGSEYAKISFTLEEKKEEDNTSTISQNNLEESEQKPDQDDDSISEDTINASKSNKVYIDAPKKVEVYLDSNYVGMSPVSFKKVVGSHTITLRKSGYKTKSYTIYLYNDGEDITYSFTDLEKEGSSVSDNKNSSKSSSKEPDIELNQNKYDGDIDNNDKKPDPITGDSGDGDSEDQKPGGDESDGQKPDDGSSEDQKPSDGTSGEQKPDDGESGGQKPGDGESEGQKPSDGESGEQKPDDGTSGEQKPGDGESEGQKPDDGESEGQKPSDGESDSQKPNEGETNTQKPSDGESDTQKPGDGESGAQGSDNNNSTQQNSADKNEVKKNLTGKSQSKRS